MTRLSKTVMGGAAAWVLGEAASGAAVSAGATGVGTPVAVAIIVGTATYLVVDWSINTITDSLKVGHLTADDVERVWPKGARGVPLERLYRKPADPAILLKQQNPTEK